MSKCVSRRPRVSLSREIEALRGSRVFVDARLDIGCRKSWWKFDGTNFRGQVEIYDNVETILARMQLQFFRWNRYVLEIFESLILIFEAYGDEFLGLMF